MKKLISAALSAALILLSPGFPAYQAFAGEVNSKGGNAAPIPALPTTSIGGNTQGLGSLGQGVNLLPNIELGVNSANLPQTVALGQNLQIPGLTTPGAHVPGQITGQTAQGGALNPGKLQASNAGKNDGAQGANNGAPKAEVTNSGAQNAEGSQKPSAEANTASELSAALKDEKSDKGGVLNWFFDRLRRKTPAPAAPLVAVQQPEQSIGALLAKATSNAAKAQNLVPAPANAAAKTDGSRWSRFKAKFDFSDFTKSEKTYLIAESVFYLALTVYLASLPILVKGITGDAASTGLARMIHYWTMAGAALFAGEIVSRTPMKRVLRLSAMTRAMIFGSIGITAVAGILGGAAGWPLFLGLVGLNALVISMHSLVNLKSGGAAKVFDSKQKIEKAGYLYTTISSALMLVVPPLLGWPIDLMAKAYGPLMGSGIGYLVVGGLMGAVALLYSRVEPLKHKDKGGEPKAEGAPSALQAFKGWVGDLWKTKHGKWGLSSLALGVAGLLFAPLGGLVVAIPAGILAALGVMVALNWEAIRAIFGNGLVGARAGIATFEAFIDDALFAVVMPSFAVDILMSGAFGNGLILSAITAGSMVASAFMLRKSQTMEKKLGQYRWLAMLTLLAAFSFIPSILLWAGVPAAATFASALGIGPVAMGLMIAVPAVFLMKLMVSPLQSRMGTLLQTTIDEDPKASKESEKIWSLMGFFEMLAAGAGGFVFTELYKNSGPQSAIGQLIGANAPMKIVTAVLVVTGLVYFIGLRMMKGQLTRPTKKTFPADKEAAALAKLETNLKRMGLPPHQTRVAEDAVDSLRPTVVVLSPASPYKLSIAQEGARQSEGDVHLALDPSWLTQLTYPDGKTRILMHKGLTFENGKATIVEYKTPRLVRYFANFYTLGANDRDDGVPLEKNHDGPQSNSVQLEKITNDKLLTRLMLAAKGVAVPATVAFLMGAHPLKGIPSAGSTMQVKTMSEDKAQIKSSIEEFLKHYGGEEVVVKPSGPQFHSGRGVKFFNRGDVDAMVEHALTLSKDSLMTQDGAVLVDGRLAPPAVYLRTKGDVSGDGAITAVYSVAEGEGKTPAKLLSRDEIAGASAKEKKDWNIRVLAARGPSGKGVTTGMFARAGAWGVPTTAEATNPEDNAGMLSMEQLIFALRRQHNLLRTDAAADQFIADLKKLGGDAVDALAENEIHRERADGDPRKDQTDFIGLDVMVVVENGRLVPKIIEINDHDAGGQWQLDIFDPARAGEHSREWMATALERARLDALRGKRVAIVGAGYQGKKFIYERAKELGVEIVLVDKGPSVVKRTINKVLKTLGLGRFASKEHWAQDLVSEFIAVDTTNHEEALGKARKKLQRSARKNGKIDGIATFWEDDVPLTAELARALGLPYHTVDAADSVRSKFRTREVMKAAGLPTPKFHEISSKDDIETAIRNVGFPAVLKPVFGAEAMGVVRVNTPAEARMAYESISKQLTKSLDDIFVYGSQMVMEQYLDGREWDADVVMQDGKPVFVSVTDNWPTREPNFVATGSSLPSRALSKAEQKEVEALAGATAKALGLKDGVVHIEGKYTFEGPRIVEANGRMGGVYVRDWVKAVWGVDLVDQQLLLAAGIPVGAYKPETPLTHLEGEFIIHEESGTLSKQDLAPGAKEHPGFHNFRVMKKPGDRVKVPFQARTGMLEAKGDSPEDAQRNLDQLRAKLILDVKKDQE